MLKARVLTALVLLPLLLAALFLLPNFYWSLLILLVVLIGASEWCRIAAYSKRVSWLYLAFTFLLGLSLLHFTDIGNVKGSPINQAAYVISVLFWLLIVPFWLIRGWQIRNKALLALVGWVVLIPTWLALVQLQSMSPVLLLAVMAVVWVADIAAYFSGKQFGKHKLAPSISPGKTWEGVAGAYFGVAIYALAWLFHDSELITHVSGFDILSWTSFILAIWVMTYFSILGDLFESWMKRQAGMKDSGNLLPGHGGILDRIDALTSTLPLVSLILICLNLSVTQ